MKLKTSKYGSWTLKSWSCCGNLWELLTILDEDLIYKRSSISYRQRNAFEPNCPNCINLPGKRMAIQDFHNLYRPQELEEVLGQEPIVASLLDLKKRNAWPHSYLLVGPAGCGKTTVGRIIAKELNCIPSNLIEIDAASTSGVDDVRALTAGLIYKGFGTNPIKVIIIDEAHALSSKAWQALLKPIEEPPEHVYFILCTTEDNKVPKTIETRCNQYNFKSVDYSTLAELVEFVAEDQNLKNITTKMANLIAQESEGSPRRALTLLAKSTAVKDIEELKVLLETAGENPTVIALCRALIKGCTWNMALKLVNEMENMQPESIRLTVINYMGKALANTQDENKAMSILAILECFSGFWNPVEKKAPLLLAIGTLTLGEE